MTSIDWYQLQFKPPVADSFVHADFWLWSEVTSVLHPHLSNFTYHWQNTTYPQAAIENGHGSDATALFQVPSQPYEQASLTDTDHQMCQEYARNVRAFADGTGLSWATYPKVARRLRTAFAYFPCRDRSASLPRPVAPTLAPNILATSTPLTRCGRPWKSLRPLRRPAHCGPLHRALASAVRSRRDCA